jgi:hypothetical protein
VQGGWDEITSNRLSLLTNEKKENMLVLVNHTPTKEEVI